MVVFSLSVLTLIAILWYLGWYAKRWVVTGSDYLLAGRQVSLLPGTAGICGIAFAGSMTSIIPGLTVQYGFAGWILGSGFPIVLGYVVYGLLASPYIRRCGAYTLPEWLEMRFDARTRVVVSAATLLGVSGIVSMNVVAMAYIMTGFLDVPLWVMITVVLLGHLMFILLGGLWALTLTDAFQVLLGLALLPAMAAYCVWTFGGWDVIAGNFVSASPLSQGTLGSFPWLGLGYPNVLTVFLVLGVFIQWGSNYYWLRAAAARSEGVACRQYVWGGITVLAVYGSLGVLGLYAGAVHREAFLGAGAVSPMSAYGLLMRDFPSGMALAGLVAALAATISTTSNAHMGVTSTLVRDVYQRFFRPGAGAAELLRAGRLLTLATGGAIWCLCFYPGGPYFLLAVSCAMLGPAALVFAIGHGWPRVTAAGAFWGTLAGTAAMLAFEALQLTGLLESSVHTVVVGTAATLPALLVISLLGARRPGAAGGAARTATLTADHLRALGLVRSRYGTMAEVSDMLAQDSARVNRLVRDLEMAGLLRRGSPGGLGFLTLALTEAGENHAGAEAGAAASPDSLDARVLECVEDAPRTLREIAAAVGAPVATVGVVVNHLDRLGYLGNAGVWSRSVFLSPGGKGALAEYRRRGLLPTPPR